MRQIKATPITHENFASFGQFYTMENPSGYPLSGEIHRFFPDRLSASCGTSVGYSPSLVKKPAEMLITQAEYHTTTWEMILPLNDDMIIHCAPPSNGTPVPEYTQAFLVPRHTLVKLNACVWHLAPLPVNAEELCAMIILPECTYCNDCTVVDLKAEEQFTITID